MDEYILILLSSEAAQLSKDIFQMLDKGRLKPSNLGYEVANDIAARLRFINTHHDSLPPSRMELDVEQLCHSILRDMHDITQPAKESTSLALQRSLSLFEPSFNHESSSDDAETCLIAFFETRIKTARGFKTACDDLIGRLVKEEGGDIDELPDSPYHQFDIPYLLEHITQCEPTSHEVFSKREPESHAVRHPARLCLHDLPHDLDSASSDIAVVISTMDMSHWQEIRLNIQPKGSADGNHEPLGRGDFCRILEKETAGQLFLSFGIDKNLSLLNKTEELGRALEPGPGKSLKDVLCHYDLAPKDKILLSDTIWFMGEDGNRKHKGQLPLRAYLPFPFDISDNTMPDIMYEDCLVHRCPRIFDIGVLLLEIGLGRTFPRANRRDAIGRANFNHKIAIDKLLQLQKRQWHGFTDKVSFAQTVKFCLDSENFTSPSKQLEPIREGADLATEPTAASGWRQGISMRKRIFYENVVRPLGWLAKKFFKAQAGDITYVSKKLPEEISTTGAHLLGAFFHDSIDSRMWFRDLKRIGHYVEHKRRGCEAAVPVRIAILDTGCNRDFRAFQARSEQFAVGKDFVDPGATTMTDTFGHGTLMARLITECAPGAEIVAVRVAETTEKLGESREKIKEAILWAGRFGEADIISMSFGFLDDDGGIREAIETVHKERRGRVIFLASAGNSSTDDESFPARHPSVISVYATDCHGTFLRSNSASTTNGAAILGTYGDDIPAYIREEFSAIYPDVCQSGSSIATAIMAGISATLLIYAGILPSLTVKAASASLQRIWTTKGMEKVLDRLVQKDPEHARLKAVKPAWFWKDKPSDFFRFIAMADALSDLH
ncbi:hypothetical protein ACQKWADRAFT_320713 [Trichoderma austrokoningii]